MSKQTITEFLTARITAAFERAEEAQSAVEGLPASTRDLVLAGFDYSAPVMEVLAEIAEVKNRMQGWIRATDKQNERAQAGPDAKGNVTPPTTFREKCLTLGRGTGDGADADPILKVALRATLDRIQAETVKNAKKAGAVK